LESSALSLVDLLNCRESSVNLFPIFSLFSFKLTGYRKGVAPACPPSCPDVLYRGGGKNPANIVLKFIATPQRRLCKKW
jgi:hypothetical protein